MRAIDKKRISQLLTWVGLHRRRYPNTRAASAQTETYFSAEKTSGVLWAVVGVLAAAIAVRLWQRTGAFGRRFALPLGLLALLELVVLLPSVAGHAEGHSPERRCRATPRVTKVLGIPAYQVLLPSVDAEPAQSPADIRTRASFLPKAPARHPHRQQASGNGPDSFALNQRVQHVPEQAEQRRNKKRRQDAR